MTHSIKVGQKLVIIRQPKAEPAFDLFPAFGRPASERIRWRRLQFDQFLKRWNHATGKEQRGFPPRLFYCRRLSVSSRNGSGPAPSPGARNGSEGAKPSAAGLGNPLTSIRFN